MGAQLIDGNAIAQAAHAKLAERAAALARQDVTPALAVVLVGDNAASKVYVRNKISACEQAGIRSLRHHFAADVAPEVVLERAHITVNKNAIPNDPEKPTVTSGIRVGTAAMTTRGFGLSEARTVANLIADALEAPADAARLAKVANGAKALCKAFPVYRVN